MSKRAVTVALIAAFAWSGTGCKKKKVVTSTDNKTDVSKSTAGSGAATTPGKPGSKVQQLPPPLDPKTPPDDAVKTASGLVYKKLVTADGPSPGRNDTVVMHYTGWKPSGETFFTTRTRGQPMPLNLSTSAPAFTEALQLLHKGEKVMLWVPPSIGFKGTPQPGAETLAYEIEVVDIQAAPPVPADVAAPPATAKATATGTKYEIVKPGTGTAGAKSYDTATFHLTGWDSTGKMFDTSELRKRPITSTISKQPAGVAEALQQMQIGERRRIWMPGDKLPKTRVVAPGLVCYEIELQSITAGKEPPPVPSDVAAPPKDAKKSPAGVFYKVLSHGSNTAHPAASDRVSVHYTGWTTDGNMFDSSVTKGQPATFALTQVIKGWTDGLQLMTVGDKYRFWIPVELAYNHAAGKPDGMLVFDVELLDINPQPGKPGMPGATGATGAKPATGTPAATGAKPAH